MVHPPRNLHIGMCICHAKRYAQNTRTRTRTRTRTNTNHIIQITTSFDSSIRTHISLGIHQEQAILEREYTSHPPLNLDQAVLVIMTQLQCCNRSQNSHIYCLGREPKRAMGYALLAVSLRTV